LVTGANGFIGSSLVEGLLQQGYTVRAMVRQGSDMSLLRGLTYGLVNADFKDLPALARACSRAEFVFHLAARASDWGAYQQFYEANVEATKAIAEAARQAGVRRLVYVSTATVYGPDSRRHVRECDLSGNLRIAYARTKRMAEDYLLGLTGLEVVIVRPGDVMGPRDRISAPSMIRSARNYLLPCVASGNASMCYTYIGNLIKGIILAAERGRASEAYNISDGIELSYQEFFDELSEALRRPKIRLHVPIFIAYPISAIYEFVYHLFRSKNGPSVTRYRVLRAFRDCHMSIEKARKELGYEPDLDLKAQVRALTDWYLAWEKTCR
jgi:nucleoside-diphosphate-sugar epimerase